jgi:hypothetical protein
LKRERATYGSSGNQRGSADPRPADPGPRRAGTSAAYAWTRFCTPLAQALLSATDESQGLGDHCSGFRSVGWPVARGLRSRRVGSGRSVGEVIDAVFARVCVVVTVAGACRRDGERLGCRWARVTDVAKCRRQELWVCRAALPR